MKVYIVTSGTYSDYGIVEVFTDLKKAELLCATHNKGNVYEPYIIETWETNDSKIEANKTPKRLWCFRERYGDIIVTEGYLTFEEKEYFKRFPDGTCYGEVIVGKNTSKKAVEKIVADKIAKHKAEYALQQ